MKQLWACLVLLVITPAFSQPAPLVSPEVAGDGRVTFRLRAPNVKEVLLNLEGGGDTPMQKDDQGVWSLTVGPLTPDYYGYGFIADGTMVIDPSTPLMKPNLLFTESMVHVPGPSTLPWELNNIPHGIVRHHFYHSAVVGDDRDFYVYTPPGYDENEKEKYPVLYLLHGFSDAADGWVSAGRTNVIMDNLIQQGKVKPMLVVMPLGYGAPEVLKLGFGSFQHEELKNRNFARFTDALLGEVIPQVEKAYRVKTDARSRAIAGLSMGGSESLLTGLNHRDKFAYVGAFSSGGLSEKFDDDFPGLDAKANAQLRVLWIACGTGDGLIDINRKFREWLKTKGVQHTDIETPGQHTWMVWRRNLAEFSGLLFRDK